MFIATIRSNGRMSMSPSAAKRFEAWKMRMVDRQVVIDEYRPKRSNQQHKFYWVYLGVIENETGQDANELHAFFKATLLPPKFITQFGKEVQVTASTTELDKGQFSAYMEKICALTHIPIPNPEDAGFISNHKPYGARPKVAAGSSPEATEAGF